MQALLLVKRSTRKRRSRSGASSSREITRNKCLDDLLSHRLRLRKEIKIVRPAGLRISARHVESAERMCSDHRPRAFAVDVQVPNVELADCPFDLVARTGIDRACQSEFRVIRDLKRVIEAARLDHRQHGPEDFFLLEL